MAGRHQIRENMLLAFDTLRSHKFRSFLTVLGVVIGTTTVIAVTSLMPGSTTNWWMWPSSSEHARCGYTKYRWARRTP